MQASSIGFTPLENILTVCWMLSVDDQLNPFVVRLQDAPPELLCLFALSYYIALSLASVEKQDKYPKTSSQ